MSLARIAIAAALLLAPAAHAQQADFGPAAEKLAALLEDNYVIPDTGARYAAALRARAATYAGETRDVAERLTADLQSVAPDRHLRVVPEADAAAGGGPRRVRIAPGGSPPPGSQHQGQPGAQPRMMRPPAIVEMKWAAEGVACIAFNEFPGDPTTLAMLDAFMREHASAKALIIDARTHRGGGMGEIDVMLPYLFSTQTNLVAMDMSKSVVEARGWPFAGRASLRLVDAPPHLVRQMHTVSPRTDETRLQTAKVFLLTSRRTASAAEHLALALKRTRRATLVGEPTAGANHFGGFEPIGQGLSVFLPVGRTIDPDTGADWEGVGVQPDVAVPADQALETALRLARET